MVTLLVFAMVQGAMSQTIPGGGSSGLSHRSSGSGASDWTLNENGYVGTYFTLDNAGPVTLTVEASGTTNDAVSPHMNIVVADTKVGFDVTSGFSNYGHTFNLPAGTYFVRTEFNNDVPSANRQLTVRNLSIAGATSVSNTNTQTTNDASALAAADTYIANFRKGPANVLLPGVASGTPVEVKMVRNAFNFGTMVQGFDATVFLAPVAPGDTTSTAARYQNFVNEYFNILVPSNMGKWQPNENTQNVPTMGHVDTILNYAQSHGMNVRMHNLIWGNQQPTWVNTLITNAGNPNPAISGPAKSSLMNAIANRIAYYVGDGDADQSDGDRARKYLEIDVLNEARRNPVYWNIFGAQGVAQIHKMVKDAVEAAGADTRLYTNEYNVFNYSNDPSGGASDPYANWYRRNIEEINNAGFGQVVTGVGIQYNSEPRAGVSQAHSPARMNQVLQNMSVTGLPISITEFSVPPSAGTFPNVVPTTEQRAALIYDEALRLIYGSPQATSFLIWEPWPPATTDTSTIFDNSWNLRAAGQALVSLLTSWKTPTQNLLVGADGTIDFTGFYGDYEITIGGQTFDLSHEKGIQDYSLTVTPGDYNGDGTVDAADYVVWQKTVGQSVALTNRDNANSGPISAADFDSWRKNFGRTAPGDGDSGGDLVPEPSAEFMLLLAIVWNNLRSTRSGLRSSTSCHAPFQV
jgi:GH35 family endo-1,4-beta-xylanase